MATIGTLVVNVAANADAFQKGMKEAQQQLAGFQGAVNERNQQLQFEDKARWEKMIDDRAADGSTGAGMFEGMGDAIGDISMQFGLATAAAAGFFAVFAGGLEVADRFGDIGETLGATAGEIFNLQSVVGAEQMDNVVSGLQRVQRTLGEATNGSREAQQTFEQLGIDWEELANAPLPEMAQRVSEAIVNSGGSANQAAAAFQLFGRTGQQALEQIRRLAEGQRGGGFIVTGTDVTVLASLADRMEAFNNAATGGLGIWESLKVKVAAVAVSIAQMMENLSQTNPRDFAAEAEQRAAQQAEAQRLANQQQAARRQQEEADKQAAEAFERGRQSFLQMNQSLDQQIASLQMADNLAATYGISLQEAAGMAQQLQQFLRLAAEMGLDATQVDEFIRKLEEAQQLQFAQGIAQQFQDPIEAAAQQVDRLNEAFDNGLLTLEQYAAAMNAVAQRFQGMDAGKVSLPQAMMAGSREAISAQNRFQAQAERRDQKQDLAQILERNARRDGQHQERLIREVANVRQAFERARGVMRAADAPGG